MEAGFVQLYDERFLWRPDPRSWSPIVVCGALGTGKSTELTRLAKETNIPILYGVAGKRRRIYGADVPQIHLKDVQPKQWVIVDDLCGYDDAIKRGANIYALGICANEVRITDRPGDAQFRRTTFPLR